ncbi:MAG: hypothetical protein RLZZ385_916 [Pseudomonadota bacterium]
MRDNDELSDIPSIVPSRDDVDTHKHTRKQQGQQIVRPGYYTEKIKVSTWPVRIMITLLTLVALGGGAAAYYFYGLYETNVQDTARRISDLETKLVLMGDTAEQSDNTLMENIQQTIEQYDLLWANWRANNRKFEDLESELARLGLVNSGQDEATANLTQQVAGNSAQLNAANTRINTLANEFEQLNRSVATLNASVTEMSELRGELASIRTALNSGDTTLLGLVGRLEYMEESMESVNAHRLQINESLFRLQQSLEAMQRAQQPGSGP